MAEMSRSNDALVNAAIAAWHRSGERDQPSAVSDVVTYKRKKYVVLVNINGLLGVYRVRPDGILRRMKRWPKAIED